MEKDLKTIMNSACNVEPPKYLRGVILARIQNEVRKRQLRRKMLSISSFFVAGAGIVCSIVYFGREIVASDFWSIASLAFSDMGMVARHWQEFALSLLETLPVVSIIAVLAPIAVLLFLIKYYAEHLNSLQLTTNN